MPPKAKKGGKAAKGAEKAKPENAGGKKTEYDDMDAESLREVIPMLKQRLDKAKLDRNYVQLERDSIQTFYDISKKEMERYNLLLLAADRKIEACQGDHRIEVRVYMQKVKHLEYEHQQELERIKKCCEESLKKEKEWHDEKKVSLGHSKQSLRDEAFEQRKAQEEEIALIKENQRKSLIKLEEQLEDNLKLLKEVCEKRVKELQEDLELWHRVEIHEVEERKNGHINELIKNHEKSFREIKDYYKDITKDNLKLIKTLKEEISEKRKTAVNTAKSMKEVSIENKTLSEPLEKAQKEVRALQHELRDEEKSYASLRNARARLVVIQEKMRKLEITNQEFRTKITNVILDREKMLQAFQHATKTIQNSNERGNQEIVGRIEQLKYELEQKRQKIQEIIQESSSNPSDLQQVSDEISDEFSQKLKQISSLNLRLARAKKDLGQSMELYRTKLLEFGLREEELDNLGFVSMQESMAGLSVAK